MPYQTLNSCQNITFIERLLNIKLNHTECLIRLYMFNWVIYIIYLLQKYYSVSWFLRFPCHSTTRVQFSLFFFFFLKRTINTKTWTWFYIYYLCTSDTICLNQQVLIAGIGIIYQTLSNFERISSTNDYCNIVLLSLCIDIIINIGHR